METKYTPGPWAYSFGAGRAWAKAGEYFSLFKEDDPKKEIIGACGCCGSPWCDDADARLIAAAPEMFELLLRLKGEVDNLDGRSVEDEALVDQYRALMAKVGA